MQNKHDPSDHEDIIDVLDQEVTVTFTAADVQSTVVLANRCPNCGNLRVPHMCI